MKKITTKRKITLIIFGLLLSVLVLEIGLRIGGFIFLFLQEYRNRIAIKQRGSYRILCLGESNTAVGGKYSYPSQLEEILNQRNIGIKFSVINKGIPGTNTGVIGSQLEDNLNKYTPDMVMTMMGLGDGGNILPYEDIPTKKIALSLKSLKTYKLVKLRSKFKEQEKMFKEAIEINPKNDQAYVELAGSYLTLGKYAKAEEILKKAIEINPKNDRAYDALGWYYKNQGKYDKTEEMFKKAIEINPENDGTYATLGLWYKDRGEYDKAEEILKKAIRVNPQNDRVYRGLSLLYERQGKNKAAEEYFRKADSLRSEYYNPLTRRNYQRLREIVIQREIRLVCVQYPMCSVEPLKKMFKNQEGIIFVDNERVFKEAVKGASYEEYFIDMFGGDFGHCTSQGNRLLAENIANVILKKCF